MWATLSHLRQLLECGELPYAFSELKESACEIQLHFGMKLTSVQTVMHYVRAKHPISSGHINHTKHNATLNKTQTFYKNSMCNPSIHVAMC